MLSVVVEECVLCIALRAALLESRVRSPASSPRCACVAGPRSSPRRSPSTRRRRGAAALRRACRVLELTLKAESMTIGCGPSGGEGDAEGGRTVPCVSERGGVCEREAVAFQCCDQNNIQPRPACKLKVPVRCMMPEAGHRLALASQPEAFQRSFGKPFCLHLATRLAGGRSTAAALTALTFPPSHWQAIELSLRAALLLMFYQLGGIMMLEQRPGVPWRGDSELGRLGLGWYHGDSATPGDHDHQVGIDGESCRGGGALTRPVLGLRLYYGWPGG
eukprot:2559428-Rhodomonas_salina.1